MCKPDIEVKTEDFWHVFYNGRIYVILKKKDSWNLHHSHGGNPVLVSNSQPDATLDWLMSHAKN